MLENSKTGSKPAQRRMVEVEITSKRWGSSPHASVKTIEVPVIGESAIRLDITLDLRKTDTIEIRPVRRDLGDVDGMLDDASKLANS